MFTRPLPGKLLTTDDLLTFIDELERMQASIFGDGFTVEPTSAGPKVAVDHTTVMAWQAAA